MSIPTQQELPHITDLQDEFGNFDPYSIYPDYELLSQDTDPNHTPFSQDDEPLDTPEAPNTSACERGGKPTRHVASASPRSTIFSGTCHADEAKVIYSTPEGVRQTEWRRADLAKRFSRTLKSQGLVVLYFRFRVAVYDIFLLPDNTLDRQFVEAIER